MLAKQWHDEPCRDPSQSLSWLHRPEIHDPAPMQVKCHQNAMFMIASTILLPGGAVTRRLPESLQPAISSLSIDVAGQRNSYAMEDGQACSDGVLSRSLWKVL